ncbi:MAG: hypothetical protein KKC99_11995, partial [Proteobacteria bacterium]|nr:hypothetical protein [Pseudomonadota bacterium]
RAGRRGGGHPMSDQTNDTARMPARRPRDNFTELLEILRLGLQVYASEMRWLGYALLRRFEVSRLAKRLDEEYTRLGHLAAAPDAQAEEKKLCHKQISFLKEEIATLENELEARRIQRVNTLRSRQGHSPIDGPLPEEHSPKQAETANIES